MSSRRIQEILDFWFEGVNDASVIDRKAMPYKKWFLGNKALDDDIRLKFETDLGRAAHGEYKEWEDTIPGRLALILLYDQFSRNMFRGTPQMYAYDALALELALRTIREGRDHELCLIERVFLYMPLMHFAHSEMQALSVRCFEQLVAESRTRNTLNLSYYEYTLKHAHQHQETVLKFGRFPHRDQVLKGNHKFESHN